MIDLMIRRFGSLETCTLIDDVRCAHPQWVHDQMGTDSESELQGVLGCYSIEDMVRSAPEEDACGMFVGCEVYVISASMSRDGQDLALDQAEVLGEAYGHRYTDLDEAIEMADALQSEVADYDLDPSTVYHVYTVNGVRAYSASPSVGSCGL